MSAAHTPTPWTVDAAEGWVTADDGRGVPLATPWIEQAWDCDPLAIANAAFIVRAVNAHDDLVAALRVAKRWMQRGIQYEGCPEAHEQVDVALAKAEAQS